MCTTLPVASAGTSGSSPRDVFARRSYRNTSRPHWSYATGIKLRLRIAGDRLGARFPIRVLAAGQMWSRIEVVYVSRRGRIYATGINVQTLMGELIRSRLRGLEFLVLAHAGSVR